MISVYIGVYMEKEWRKNGDVPKKCRRMSVLYARKYGGKYLNNVNIC